MKEIISFVSEDIETNENEHIKNLENFIRKLTLREKQIIKKQIKNKSIIDNELEEITTGVQHILEFNIFSELEIALELAKYNLQTGNKIKPLNNN